MQRSDTITVPDDVTLRCPLSDCTERIEALHMRQWDEAIDNDLAIGIQVFIVYTALPCGHPIPPAQLAGLGWLAYQQIQTAATRRN